MAEYEYAGPHPVPDEDGELVHPGDVREYAEEPGWGPWELLGDPAPAPGAGRQSGTGPAPAQAAADGGQPIVTPDGPATPKGK